MVTATSKDITSLLFPFDFKVVHHVDDICKKGLFEQHVSSFLLQSLGYVCVSSKQYIDDTLYENFSNQLHVESRNPLRFSLSVEHGKLITYFNYFKVMFEIGMRESQEGKVELRDVELIDFLHIYKHLVDISENICEFCCMNDYSMLLRMIDVAIYFQSDTISKKFTSFLLKHITATNCLDVMVCAYKYSEQDLFSCALRYSLFYAHSIRIETLEKHFISYPELVNFYVLHSMLNISCEQLKDLSQTIGKGAFVLSGNEPKVPLKSLSTRMRLGKVEGFRIQLVGDKSCADDSDDKMVLLESWLPSLANPRGDEFIGYHVCSHGEKIYISGGEIGLGRGRWNDYIYKADTIERSVDIIGEIPCRRRHHKSCCNSTSLYIAGGLDRYRCKRDEVYKMDIQSGCKSNKLPSVPDVVGEISVTEGNDLLGIMCGQTIYTLDLVKSQAEWQLASEDDIKLLPFSRQSDKKSVTSVWYPFFELPKFS